MGALVITSDLPGNWINQETATDLTTSALIALFDQASELHVHELSVRETDKKTSKRKFKR